MTEKPSNETTSKNIEVWEDVVNIRDLIFSLIISSVTTLGGYLIAPNDASKPLIFGLIGAVIGFVICSVLFKPKRTFEYIDEEEQ
ncbi:hypothetical protein KQI49_08060 [Virgibacillus sp. MSJ-26]|uniref:hypothetical protein n=1 Tax=Virgibacillus sp. MSJ-26 TaxID=2841522 RepID=UPI001C122C94|nr:hypothetical protein [Virgibacillus sp. MSJ-26]MBU5466786.1 hypothetical protein [Virgibacillus sp. MSJ-26]